MRFWNIFNFYVVWRFVDNGFQKRQPQTVLTCRVDY